MTQLNSSLIDKINLLIQITKEVDDDYTQSANQTENETPFQLNQDQRHNQQDTEDTDSISSSITTNTTTTHIMTTIKPQIRQNEEEFKPIITQQPSHLVGQLRSYQLLALDYLLRVHQKSLLYKNYFKKLGVQEPELSQYQINAIEADQMGLGKTIVTQSLLASIYEIYGIRGLHLIVVPKSTVPQWQSEYKRFYPYARVCSVVGYKEEREISLNQLLETPTNFDIVITTYDIVKIEAEKFKTLQFQYVIVDEGQKLKSQDTIITSTIQQLKTKHKLILTGTPIQNDISELFSLLNVLSPTIFNNVEEFTSLVTNQNTEIIQQILHIFMIRRTKQEVETLPEKHEFLIKVPMTTLQRKLYIGLLTHNVDALQQAVQSKSSTIHKTSLLNTLMQLRKVADHPYLLQGVEPTPYQDGPHLKNVSGKMVVLMALINKILERNEKVLVFCQMTNMLNIIADWLNYCRLPYLRIDGATDLSQRANMLQNFNQKCSTVSIFLLSTRAGALGLNLTSANHVIIFQQDFNPQVDSQAVARAHRIGQTKQCYIYRLLTANTVDEKIYQRACIKMQLDELVMQQSHFTEDKVIETDLVKQAGKEGLIDMIQYQSNELFEQQQKDQPTPDYNQTEEIKFTDEQIEKLLSEAKEEQDKAYKEAEERKIKKEEIIKKLQQDGKLQGFDTKELYKFDGEVYSKQNLKKLTEKIKAQQMAEQLVRWQKQKGSKNQQKGPEKPKADYPTVAKFKRNQVLYRADYYLLDHKFYELQDKILKEVQQIQEWFQEHKETVKYQDYLNQLQKDDPDTYQKLYTDTQLPGLTEKEVQTYRQYLELNCPYYNSKNFSHDIFNHILDSLINYRADKLINQLQIRKAMLCSHHQQRGIIKKPILGENYKLFYLVQNYKTAEEIDDSGNPMPELGWQEYCKRYKNESTQQNYMLYATNLLKRLNKLDNYKKYKDKFKDVKEDRKQYFKNIKVLRTYVEMYKNPLFEMPVDKVSRQSSSGHVFSIVQDRYLLWLTDLFGFNNFNDIMTYIKNCKTFMLDWEFKSLKQEEVDTRINELMVDVYRVAGNEIVAEEEYTGSEYSDKSYYESDE